MATKTEFGGPEVKVGIALASTTRTPGTPRILNVNVMLFVLIIQA